MLVELLQRSIGLSVALHIDDDGAVHQRQRQHADRCNSKWSEHRKLARPTADKPTDRPAAAMPGVEHRAQRWVVEQPEIVALIEQQRVLAVAQRVKDCRRSHVVTAIGIGGQRFEQDQCSGLATAPHRTQQRQAWRDRVTAEDVAV